LGGGEGGVNIEHRTRNDDLGREKIQHSKFIV